eukprot:4305236-Alexandrium_andersonii.AAC.1
MRGRACACVHALPNARPRAFASTERTSSAADHNSARPGSVHGEQHDAVEQVQGAIAARRPLRGRNQLRMRSRCNHKSTR